MKMALRMKSRSDRRWPSTAAFWMALTVSLLAGCATPINRAPVEDRHSSVRPVTPVAASTTVDASPALKPLQAPRTQANPAITW